MDEKLPTMDGILYQTKEGKSYEEKLEDKFFPFNILEYKEYESVND